MAIEKGALIEKLLPVLLALSIVLAFVVGMLWQRVANIEGGNTANAPTQPTNNAPNNPPASGKLSADQAAKLPKVSSDDHIKGDKNALVMLIEYSDYECPFCKQFHPTMQKLVDEYKGQVAWIYRDFPLEVIHPKAKPTAEAAECVAELGGDDAFWTFTDAAFAGAPASLNDLTALAVKAGVSATDFESCTKSGRTADKVQADYDGGSGAGITGTPGTFVINNKCEVWLVPGALPFESIKSTIDEALAS